MRDHLWQQMVCANGLTSDDIGVSETGSTPVGHSLQLEGSGSEYDDFFWVAPSGSSFGELNAGQLIALPITLTAFSAKPMDEKTVQLHWTTASEENNDYFAIEHSRDGRSFNELDYVMGAGTTTEAQHYQFVHKEAVRGSNYYRLRQVDFDGTFSLSDIEVVVLKDKKEIIVQPTLAQQSIEVSINEGLANDGAIQVVNWLGQIVKNETFAEKTNNITLDVSDLESGHYILRLNSGTAFKSTRFVKF